MVNTVYMSNVFYLFFDRWGCVQMPLSINTPIELITNRLFYYMGIENNPKNKKAVKITEIEYLNTLGL